MPVQDLSPERAAPVTGSAAYVYGVVSSAAAAGGRGIAGGGVRAVAFGDVAALVSDVELPIRARRRDLVAHSDVLNEALRHATVLPFRFGTTFPSESAVVSELLEPRHDELRALLTQFEGRVELMVKAFYREEAVLAEIVRDDPRVARLRELARGRSPAAARAIQIDLGSAVAAALAARAQADASSILTELRPLALDVHVDDTPIEQQVLRASLLVEHDGVGRVDAAMQVLAERHAGRIHFKYVGPLAPHSFVALSGGGSA